MSEPVPKDMIVVCNSAKKLGNNIAEACKLPIANYETKLFANGELRTQLERSVRSSNLFIVSTGYGVPGFSINDALMELVLMIDTCKRSACKSVTLLLPSYPYSRQDKKDSSRASISAKTVADMLVNAGADRIIALDLHNPAIQGFTNSPFDNLYSSLILVDYLQKLLFEEVSGKKTLLSPDLGANKLVDWYSQCLKLPFVTMLKSRDLTKENTVMSCKIQGDVNLLKDATIVAIDDIADTMSTMVEACKNLKEYGVKNVIVVCTHGLLSGAGVQKLNDCQDISMFICTDSVPQDEHVKKCSKVRVVSIAPLYGKVVQRLINGESISELFK